LVASAVIYVDQPGSMDTCFFIIVAFIRITRNF